MDRRYAVFFLIATILVGLGKNLLYLLRIRRRLDFTFDYRDKFIGLCNSIFDDRSFQQDVYHQLTIDVKAMQKELGHDGILAQYTDNLKGFSVQNYELLINFLPELRMAQNHIDNSILRGRYNQAISTCDDMFLRHIGSLNETEKDIKKHLFNPITCFADGIKLVISMPIFTLKWLGIVSDEGTLRIQSSFFFKIINWLVAFIGFFSAIVTIVIGWDDFWSLIHNWLLSIK